MGEKNSTREYLLSSLPLSAAAGLFMLMCSRALVTSPVFSAVSALAAMISLLICACVCGRLKAPYDRLAAFLPAAVMLCADLIMNKRFLAEAASAADEAACRRALVSGELFFASAESTPPLLLTMTACALLCAVCTAFGAEVSAVIFAAGAVGYCAAFGGSATACGVMAVCVCIVLTGERASAVKRIAVTALTAAAVMVSAFFVQRYTDGQTPRFSGEVTAPQGQPLYLMHEVLMPDMSKNTLLANSETVYKLAENGFAPQLQSAYLIKASKLSEPEGRVVLPENTGLSPEFAVSAEGSPLRRGDAAGFEKDTSAFTAAPLMYRDILLLTDSLDEEESADYLRCEALCREFAYRNFAGISSQDSELISKYISADLTKTQYERLKAVRDFIGGQISPSPESKGLTLEEMLSKKTADPEGMAHLSVMLLRNSGFAAREVRGCCFKMIPQSGKADLKDADYRTWAEVYMDGAGWIPFEASGEYALPLPALPEGSGDSQSADDPLPPSEGDIILTQPQLAPAAQQEDDTPLKTPDIRLLAIPLLMLVLWWAAVFIIRNVKKRRIFGKDVPLCVKTAHFEALRMLAKLAPIGDTLPEDIPEILEKTLGSGIAEKYDLSRRAYEKLMYSPAGAKAADAEKARGFYTASRLSRKENTPLAKRIMQALFSV